MARKSPQLSLLRLYLIAHRHKPLGFTLLELLVALIIGSIITFLMLFTVIELLKTNQREAARSDTQRDMQAALDYITRDLREAVYVYDADCFTGDGTTGTSGDKCPGLMQPGILPTSWSASQTNSTPVLAFWRIDELPQALKDRCVTNIAAFGDDTTSAAAQAAQTAVAGVACISKRTYSLVIYSLQKNDPTDTIWKGKAKLTRYELPQFPANQSGGTVTRTIGWGNPVQEGGGFRLWPFYQATLDSRTPPAGAVTTAAASPTVLVDFINYGDLLPSSPPDVGCPKSSSSFPYKRSTTDARFGFYVCVNGANASNQNQEVAVYLQGNAVGKPGIPSNANVIIPLETRVMTRGALQKQGS